ncbi:MAG TPA: hypothetical protein VFV90_08465 [Usitatibacter sp.]|jgi:hypothetical protein|nr:hypothetical protein [Usitatibacter sp.]
MNHGTRHKIWKLLTNPAIELVVTVLLAMVATWYLIETGPTDAFPVFGRH